MQMSEDIIELFHERQREAPKLQALPTVKSKVRLSLHFPGLLLQPEADLRKHNGLATHVIQEMHLGLFASCKDTSMLNL